MANITDLSPEQLRKAASIKEEIARLENELQSLLGDQGVSDGAPKKGGMSAAGRARIAAAARARWTKLKAAKAQAKPAGQKKMSAAARAKISAAAKERWAKIKAAKSASK